MLKPVEDAHSTLSRRLLQLLRPLAMSSRTARGPGLHTFARQLFSYCCIERERLVSVVSEMPRIGIVLSGEKEFWLGDAGQRFVAGDVFVLPAGTAFDAVNIPSEASGLYESLLVEITQVPKWVQEMPGARPVAGFDLRVPLSQELVDALGHAAISLSGSDHAAALAGHRLAEVLILLRKMPVAQPLFAQSLAERAAWLVARAPAKRWTAEEIGRELGVGASTLRRKLVEAGTSLRGVQASARMQLAHEMLVRGEGNITDAANAAGYASRSHFARRFQAVYGASPAEIRLRQTALPG
ncbi:helix-turn-helix transcriptional regulator [Aminobacter carboxidus]|uniref:AraC-like DNA-binding protein n=1 Tax=Aminobacter carboxidus TaxID=376165 RepID=A0A8E1W9B6_9HYPH|nr:MULTISPECIES: helix-turn-helix domain-containing protein [Aminobacter carboxidus group]MBB6464386.1 AraC-like DNA-binding protein [Aminobacter lissarensis]MBE1207686.1 helix-turn-helix domain-containing protein [Aminobacter carboxidus]